MDKDDLERAKIAVEEYKVLHAELLQRNTVLVQICGASIGGIVAIIGFSLVGKLEWYWGFFLAFVLFCVMGVVWKIVDSDARNASKRIGEIEEYVNKAVGGDNYNPLSWERRFGINKRRYRDRFRKFDFDRET